MLDEKDFQKVPIRTARSIEIRGFVQSKEIDPVYFYDCHYLEPEELGVKPFSLLRQILLKTGRVGVAKVSFQKREHLCCLRPLEHILALHTLRYPDEVLSPKELAFPEEQATAAELELAESLVKAMVRSFKPEEYEDKYRQALQQVIEAKISGKEIAAPKVPEIEVPDLMTALKASIQAALKKTAKQPVAAGAKE